MLKVSNNPQQSTSSASAQEAVSTNPSQGIFYRLQEIAQVAVGWMDTSRTRAHNAEQNARITDYVKAMHSSVLNATDAFDTFVNRAQSGSFTPEAAKAAGETFVAAISAALETDRKLSAADRKALCESGDAKLVITELHETLRDLVKLGQEHVPAAFAEASRRDFCAEARRRYVDEVEAKFVDSNLNNSDGTLPHTDTLFELVDAIDRAFDAAGPNLQGLEDAAHRAWKRDCQAASTNPKAASRPNEELVLEIKERIENELLPYETALGVSENAVHSHFSALGEQVRDAQRQLKPRISVKLVSAPEYLAAQEASSPAPEVIEAVILTGAAEQETPVPAQIVEEPVQQVAAEVAPENLSVEAVIPIAVPVTLTVSALSRPLTVESPLILDAPALVTPSDSVVEAPEVLAQAGTVLGETSEVELPVAADLPVTSVEVAEAAPELPVTALAEPPVETSETAAPIAVDEPLQLVGAGTFVGDRSTRVAGRKFGSVFWARAAMITMVAGAALLSTLGRSDRRAETQAPPAPVASAITETPPVAVAETPAVTPATEVHHEPAAQIAAAPVVTDAPIASAPETPPDAVAAGVEPMGPPAELGAPQIEAPSVPAVAQGRSYEEDFKKFLAMLQQSWNNSAIEQNPTPAVTERDPIIVAPPAVTVATEKPSEPFGLGDLTAPPVMSIPLDKPAVAQVEAPSNLGSLQATAPFQGLEQTNAVQSSSGTIADAGLGSLSAPFAFGAATDESVPSSIAEIPVSESGREAGIGSLSSAFPATFVATENIGANLASTPATMLWSPSHAAPLPPPSLLAPVSTPLPGVSTPWFRNLSAPFANSEIGFLQSSLGPEVIGTSAGSNALASAAPSDGLGSLQAPIQIAEAPVDERISAAKYIAPEGSVFALGSLQSNFSFAAAELTYVAPEELDEDSALALGSLSVSFGKAAGSVIAAAPDRSAPLRVASISDYAMPPEAVKSVQSRK